jgi:3-dehydroquinate synthase
MISIPLESSSGRYQVLVGRGLLASTGRLLREAGLEGAVRLVADEAVYRIYGPGLEEALRSDGFKVDSFAVPSGEGSKSLGTASRLYDWMIDRGTERRDLVLALGGGVVGDLAGFVAATFLRGLRLVQLPTSLLAQVDSSVGGKVAVNHARGKNLIGAFYPPSLVVADPDTLSSLPPREFSAALAEVVKMGVTLDRSFFEELEAAGEQMLGAEPAIMETIVARTVRLKARVVQEDERESGLRAILNYGHTIGHGVEAASGYSRYRHGEAVAIGMAGAAAIAVQLGMIDEVDADRQERLLSRLRLPVRCPDAAPDRMWEAMLLDKKSSRGRLRWVLPQGIGRAVTGREVPEELVRRVLELLTVRDH